MKEILNTIVEAMGKQAAAVGEVAEQVAALKKALAQQFPDMAEKLKDQVETDQDKSRDHVFELQVSLGKLREAIAELPDDGAPTENKE